MSDANEIAVALHLRCTADRMSEKEKTFKQFLRFIVACHLHTVHDA